MIDGKGLTRCCDAILAMNLARALYANPNAEVWLWTDAPWTREDLDREMFFHPRLMLKKLCVGHPRL